MATEMTTVVKKIVPYLQRRGYSVEDNMLFGELAQSKQEQADFADILIKRNPGTSQALFVIEANRDRARLNAAHRKQAMRYGTDLSFPFAVVTNGERFELLDILTGSKLKVNGSIIGKIPHYSCLDSVLRQFKKNPFLDNIDLATDVSLPFRTNSDQQVNYRRHRIDRVTERSSQGHTCVSA